MTSTFLALMSEGDSVTNTNLALLSEEDSVTSTKLAVMSEGDSVTSTFLVLPSEGDPVTSTILAPRALQTPGCVSLSGRSRRWPSSGPPVPWGAWAAARFGGGRRVLSRAGVPRGAECPQLLLPVSGPLRPQG